MITLDDDSALGACSGAAFSSTEVYAVCKGDLVLANLESSKAVKVMELGKASMNTFERGFKQVEIDTKGNIWQNYIYKHEPNKSSLRSFNIEFKSETLRRNLPYLLYLDSKDRVWAIGGDVFLFDNKLAGSSFITMSNLAELLLLTKWLLANVS